MASVNDFKQFHEDFLFLKEMKDILIELLLRIKNEPSDPTFYDSALKNGFYTETDDGREVRVILPSGFQLLWNNFRASQNEFNNKTEPISARPLNDKKAKAGYWEDPELCFVGFIGNLNKANMGDDELTKECWSLDALLTGELSDIDGMLAYVTGRRQKNGCYGNLVLFRDRGVVGDLLKSRNHGQAVNSLSPRFYNDVRIHSGKLQEGVASPFFVLQKTLFLFFSLPPEDPARRRVQLWRACREDSDVVKVLPAMSKTMGQS